MVALLLAGCFGDFSNEIFNEDAKFYSALPSPESFRFEYPQPQGDLSDDPATFYTITSQTMTTTNNFLAVLVTATGIVVAVPPSERGEDYRVWGPGAWDEFPGSYLRLEMSRTTDGSLYNFGYQASSTSGGPWSEFASGTWHLDPGSGTQGYLVFDYDLLSEVVGGENSGALTILWDAREEHILEVDADAQVGGQQRSFVSRIEEHEQGGRLDFEDDQFERALQTASFVTRWDSTGAGRADGSVYGHEEKGDFDFVQCWQADGASLYYLDDSEVPVESGAEEDCIFSDEP